MKLFSKCARCEKAKLTLTMLKYDKDKMICRPCALYHVSAMAYAIQRYMLDKLMPAFEETSNKIDELNVTYKDFTEQMKKLGEGIDELKEMERGDDYYGHIS